MKLTRIVSVPLVVMACVAAAAPMGDHTAVAATTAPAFNVVDLGLLPKTSNSWGVSESANGKYAAVESNPPSYHERAARYHSAKLKSLGTLGGANSTATDVNNAGVEVGSSLNSSQQSRAFTDTATVMTALPDLGGSFSAANAINDHGVIVGVAEAASGSDARAVEWVNGALSSLGGLGPSSSSSASAVNEAGDAAGYSWNASNNLPYHAVLFKAGQVTDLTPNTILGSQATGINAADAVVGNYCTSSCNAGAFLWSDGIVASNPLAMGGSGGIASSINDHWEVVGQGQTPTASWVPSLFYNGTPYDLNTLLTPSAAGTWTVTTASRINNQSQIAATAIDTATGQGHAVLLVPTTTPTYDQTPPTGPVTINNGAPTTTNPIVQVTAPGTDTSGIFAVRVSNSPTVATNHRLALGTTVDPTHISTTTPLSWNVTDPTTGGTTGPGTHTIYVQWLDWAGNWSAPISTTITLTS